MRRVVLFFLWIIFSVVVAVEDPEWVYDDLAVSDNDYEKWTLPNIEEIQRGFDYATGERMIHPIFRLTYEQSDSGNVDFLHADHFAKKTYKIPDQLHGSSWSPTCSSTSREMAISTSSVSEYLKTVGSQVGISYDQKTDISVTVPIKGAQISASTQTRNALGFAKSKSAQEYYYQIQQGRKRVIKIFSQAKLWKLQWRTLSGYKKEVSTDELSEDFVDSLNRLKTTCENSPPDYDGRMKGSEKVLSKSECDEAAKHLVERFGTHYTMIASFGGTVSKNYYYNEKSVTEKQKSYAQEYSKSEFALVFMSASQSEKKIESKFSEAEMSKVITEGEMIVHGGDFKATSVGEWCSSVPLSPAIVENEKLISISELIKDEPSKYAATMAILDRWICNGGSAILDKNSGLTTCSCPENKDFHLDGYCFPKDPRCYLKSGKEVKCVYSRLFIGHTTVVRHVWDSKSSLAKTEATIFVPQTPPGYELIGPVIVRGFPSSPYNLKVPILHESTLTSAAAAATDYKMVGITGLPFGVPVPPGGKRISTTWTAVCPEGYGQLSDFTQYGLKLSGNKFKPSLSKQYTNMKIRPCIIDECLLTCESELFCEDKWVEALFKGKKGYFFYKAVGCEEGCDVGHSGGFYRLWDIPGKKPDASYSKCLNPACIIEK